MKNIYDTLTKKQNISDTFNSIPYSYFEKVALILMIFLSLLPIFAIYLTRNFESIEFRYIDLQTALNTIGYLGLVYMVFYGVWNAFKKKTGNGKTGKYFVYFIYGYFVWTIISTYFAENTHLAVHGYFFQGEGLTTFIGYLGIIIVAMSIKSKEYILLIFKTFSFSSSFISFLCLINNETINDLTGLSIEKGYFSNQNHYGYFLSMAIMVALLLLVNETNKKYFPVYLIELTLLLTGLINSSSLGPLIGVVSGMFGMMVLSLFIDKSSVKKVIIITAYSFIFIIIYSSFTWNFTGDISIINGNIGNIFINKNEEAMGNFGSGRGRLWMHAINVIKENPIFGVGLDNLQMEHPNGLVLFYRPHCEILQIAASQGIPALIFYIASLTYLLIRFVKKFKRLSIFDLSIYCIIGAYLVSSLVGNTKFYTTPYFYMLLGICYSRAKEEAE